MKGEDVEGFMRRVGASVWVGQPKEKGGGRQRISLLRGGRKGCVSLERGVGDGCVCVCVLGQEKGS